MRLRTLSISGFRGFPAQATFDLEGDAVIVVGANGSGKTSLFDAILWALAGKLPRLGGDEKVVVSRYSSTGEARVELELTKPNGSPLRIVRRFDGTMSLTLEVGGEAALRGPSADARLLEELWPDARLSPDPWEALSRAVTRGVYLQQDLLRQFIEADADHERFAVIGEVIGAGRVGELQRQLESGKAAWTRSTNTLSAEVQPLRTRHDALAQRLSRLTAAVTDAKTLVGEWESWSQRAGAFIALPRLSVDAPETGRALDAALKELEALQLQGQRRAMTAKRLLLHLEAPPPETQDLEPLRRALAEAEQVARTAQARLKTIQEQAASERSRQIALRERAEELRALAQLALRHLGEHCPICEQDYDIEATRKRLKTIAGVELGLEGASPTVDVGPLAVEVEHSERLVTEAASRLGRAERANAVRAEWQETGRRLLDDLELGEDGDLTDRVTTLHRSLAERQDELQTIREVGEGFSLRLARAGEIAQRAELERELVALQAELTTRESELAARNATGELAGQILNTLREAGAEIVAGELNRIEPLLQRIYATVDPHPAFRAVRFLTRTVRGRGRLWTSIDDHSGNVSVDEPATVLSSSQLNVLAVSVFLALNLGVETLPVNMIALDDPLQSLDDVNLLGLVDLLRRMKGRRQILISTHDARFGSLLARKLRPVSAQERARLIRLEGWTREGPVVEDEEIPVDPRPLRLVA